MLIANAMQHRPEIEQAAIRHERRPSAAAERTERPSSEHCLTGGL